ncbi:Ribosome small subunit-stimulated GTPase EngC [Lachnospiraceae bacterium TWA4]|nr:Ribosome small subunit-stimulated GTPase EngC [Lachnospiraceae bacterium TWA4]
MQGKIIKGIGGFYYVHTIQDKVYECRAKGIFRNKKLKPLVGDEVEIEVLDEEKLVGNLVDILPRKNTLIRPAAANVDQALLLFACTNPEPNYIMLDKLMIELKRQHVPMKLCFNKMDLDKEEAKKLCSIYKDSVCISVEERFGMENILEYLDQKTTILAGPSGVGKSSLLNALYPNAKVETGNISRKIQRGKHTTRHCEIFCLAPNTYLMDTPGFTSVNLNLEEILAQDLRFYYPEFDEYEGSCRFQGCVHVHEPDCKVKEAVELGSIPKKRYDSYTYIWEELSSHKRYK